MVDTFDPATMTYPWRHADPRVDLLQAQLASLVGSRSEASRTETFGELWTIAHAAAALEAPGRQPEILPKPTIPHLNEPWYCCAEPTTGQAALI